MIEEMLCPVCGGTLDYNEGEIQDNQYRYDVSCTDCDWTGIEWHNLVFDGYTDVDGNPVEDQEDEDATEDHDRRAGLYGPEYPGEKF